ncbi:cellulose binding domain-containing protein [Actinomadura atramentaria]|uniref:cellulose binding domain-containing protein n=1 Tax=Actinomadura atramentaria TaxID=1990 RepID=UPI00039C0AE8|nr:cellulose binding domain-containing protein [Actinomadura atramentaria]
MEEVAERGRRGGGRRRPGRRRRPDDGPRRGRVVLLSTIAGVAAFGLTVGGLHALFGGGDEAAAGGGGDCADGCVLEPVAVPSAEPTVADSVPPRSPSATPSASASRTPGPTPSARRTDRPDRTDRPRPGDRHGRPERPGGALAATYAIGRRWDSGFIGQVTVVNRGDETVPSWRLTVVFPGTRITTGWASLGGVGTDYAGGRLTGSGGGLAPGDAVTLGFQAEGRPGPPSACTLNGSPC